MTGMRQRLADDHAMNSEKKLDKKVILNVGGLRHETWCSTLERVPGTRLALLAHLQEADESYDDETREYFFDRHPAAFNSVIHYFRSEELHVDQNVCGNVLKAEFDFWGMEEQNIEACCWGTYSRWTEHKHTLEDLDENFAYIDDDAWGEKTSTYKQWAHRIWRFLEDPASSRPAKAYAFISMFFVLLSIMIFCGETHKSCQVDQASGISMSVLIPTEYDPTSCCNNHNKTLESLYKPVTHPAMSLVDYICVAYFTFELLMRFLFCPDKLKFWKSPLNLIDVVCLLPHYITIILKSLNLGNDTTNLFKVIMMLRIVRVLRIFKLMKHYSAFKILVYTLKVSTKELGLMVVFLFTGVLLFASVIHYVERDNFPNIPIGFWWALVTMTTVGYGDKFPMRMEGYVIGVFCVLCGVLTIAFTVPIVVNNFTVYYSHAQSRIKLPQKKKRKKLLLQADRKDSPKRKPLSQQQNKCNFTDIHVQKELNIHEPEKHDGRRPQSIENNLDQPINKPIQTSKQIQRTTHGRPGHTREPVSKVGTHKVPVQSPTDNDVESNQSEDNNKHEAETRALLNDLADANRKLANERKRQEVIIKQRREQRKLQHKEPETPRDGAAGGRVHDVATEENEEQEKPKKKDKKKEKLEKKKKERAKENKNESDA